MAYSGEPAHADRTGNQLSSGWVVFVNIQLMYGKYEKGR